MHRFTFALTRCAFLLVALGTAGSCTATSIQRDLETTPQPEVTQSKSPADPVFVPAESVSEYAPNVITRQIIQDAKGDIWFASYSGVIRYDGNVYTNITNEAPLAPTRAFSLLRDKHDNIWIGTLGAGVYRYDGSRYTQFTARDGLANDRVLSMMEDRDGSIWFGHEQGGATRLAGQQFTVFGAKNGFTDHDVSSISQDGTGRIWFGTRSGLFHFDGKSFGTLEQADALPTGGYIPTLIDGNGQLWFGGGSGLHHFDGTQLRRYTSDPVWALAHSADGSLWFAGQSELQRINPVSTSQAVPSPAWAPTTGSLWSAGEATPAIINAGTLGAMVFDLFEDRDGALWIGTFGVARLLGDRIRYLGGTKERHDAIGRPVSEEARRLAQKFGTGH